ncbi:Hypothetical_protein [Hexamita inflata]|uniref:Hypothetical_protein n=1 Tax=Hexamita inflata TaxID=28002 RepID=A0ABP1K3H7_9EUKA
MYGWSGHQGDAKGQNGHNTQGLIPTKLILDKRGQNSAQKGPKKARNGKDCCYRFCQSILHSRRISMHLNYHSRETIQHSSTRKTANYVRAISGFIYWSGLVIRQLEEIKLTLQISDIKSVLIPRFLLDLVQFFTYNKSRVYYNTK